MSLMAGRLRLSGVVAEGFQVGRQRPPELVHDLESGLVREVVAPRHRGAGTVRVRAERSNARQGNRLHPQAWPAAGTW